MATARSRLSLLAFLLAYASSLTAAQVSEAPLRGESAERFLRRAEVQHLATLETGVTRSDRALLSDGEREVRAVWKIIDEFSPFKDFRDGGPPEVGFRDSYRNEIAAYELAKLVGLELIPPTVERRIQGDRGSLQLWIEGAITSAEWYRDAARRVRGTEEMREQMSNVRLLRQLTHDSDFKNASNTVVGPEDRVWAVDFSRAFRTQAKILAEDDLKRFSRSVLDRLRALDEATIRSHLGNWLSKRQQKGLLARRDLILELANTRIEEKGEEAVLYD